MKFFDKITLTIIISYSIFHFLILVDVLPQNIVWGGKILDKRKIALLELIALFVMLFIGFLILLKNKVISLKWKDRTLQIWLFIFSIYFILNTFGNLLAETIFEKAQALFTIILAIGLFKISKRNL